MKRFLWLFLIIFSTVIFSKPVLAQQLVESNQLSHQVEGKQLDKQAKILAEFLAQYDSPLQYSAQDFIDAAKVYDLDWKLLPAIAGVESTFGKQIPGGFNGWGWGVYGTQAIYFSSWKEAIYTIAQGLRENYFNKGYNEPYSINRIYAASPTWGSKVTFFMNKIEEFALDYEAKNQQEAYFELKSQIAVSSGQLNLE